MHPRVCVCMRGCCAPLLQPCANVSQQQQQQQRSNVRKTTARPKRAQLTSRARLLCCVYFCRHDGALCVCVPFFWSMFMPNAPLPGAIPSLSGTGRQLPAMGRIIVSAFCAGPGSPLPSNPLAQHNFGSIALMRSPSCCLCAESISSAQKGRFQD